MSDPRSVALESFVQWTKAFITGDEKGQAQIFLDRLFIAMGHAGSLDVGGEPEFRVRKAAQDGGGTSFADYVWKPIVLIEMKKRGEKLSRHYRQAFDYWTRLVPGRPRYVVLCNFDEFYVYDFETQMDTPVGRVALTDLPNAYGPLAFLFPGHPSPVFTDDRVAVSREAAAKLARCFNKLVKRDVPRPLAQRFILQILVALFAEDIGLLEKYFVTRLLEECVDATAFDLIGGLFTAMNSPANTGGRFKGVPYFNGGLFAEPARIELGGPEIVLLRECSKSDWSKVQPEIFGTVFEQTLDKDERHAQGAHFTHPGDIMKIIGPTIVEPWREQIEGAKTARRLGELLHRLQHFQVFDPACGSGNFLYLAYRELKRLEAYIFERLETFKSKAEGAQMRISYLSAQNFHGLDINPFAIELAKVTMMIARKLAIDELHVTEAALPLDNLDSQFRVADALITQGPGGSFLRTEWPVADVVIGNPPFHGAKKMKPALGSGYVQTLRRLYPEVPGMADYCVYWIRRTHDHLRDCTAIDPVAGRGGLVGTQNIRNNQSRVGGLDYVTRDGTIVEAVENQPWSGEANVHVSIVNWSKTQEAGIVPSQKRLWYKVEPSIARRAQWKKEGKRAAKEYDLDFRNVTKINSGLSDKTDVSSAKALECNLSPQRAFQGVTPGHAGFVLSQTAVHSMTKRDSRSADVIFPYLIGREIVSGNGTPRRWLIDFGDRNILEAQAYTVPFAHISQTVLPDIQAKAAKEHETETARKQHLDHWWLHWRRRSDMKAAIARLNGRYITASRTQRWPFVFCFMDSSVLPGDKMQIFALDDDFSFGVIQSSPHLLWYEAKAARLKNEEDYNYSSESVFDTFPWPQLPASDAVRSVAEAGRAVRRIRAEVMTTLRGGLRALYRTLELPGTNPLKTAHAALDEAVLAAYGFRGQGDILEQLIELNREVTARIERGEQVSSPGIPASYPNPAELVTEDCIRPTGS